LPRLQVKLTRATTLDDTSRHSYHDDTGRHILGYYGSAAYNCLRADGYIV
jgi:hypothetical protein